MQIQKYKKTELGDIPEDWQIATIGSFLKINMGQSPSSETYNLKNIGLPFYQGVSEFKDIYPKPRIWCSDPKKIANENEILFSVRAPVGEINLTNEKCCIGRGIASLFPIKSDLKYCFYLLKFFKDKFIPYSQGSTFQAINRNQIDHVKVPFTSEVKEQQKIASILSNVDNLIKETNQIIEQTQRIKKGLMQRLLTKGIGHTTFKKTRFGEIPEEWNIDSLIKYVSKIGSGITPSGGSKIYQKNGIPFIRSQNVHFDGLRLDDVVYISVEIDEQMKNTRINPNDVLLNITGASIGRCALVPLDMKHGNVNQHVCIIRPIEKLNSKFLTIYLSSDIIQNLIRSTNHGLSREGLTFAQISMFPLILPSLSEQNKIATIISDIGDLIKKLKDKKKIEEGQYKTSVKCCPKKFFFF